MNLNYKKIYDILHNDFRYNYLTLWQERMNEDVRAESKRLFPRRKNHTWNNLPVEIKDEINARWKPIGENINIVLDNREKLLKSLLSKAAKEKIKIIFTETLQPVYSSDTYTYNNQPNRVGYARGNAEMKMEYLQKFGVICEIRTEDKQTWYSPHGDGYSCTFVIYANIENWQYDYFQHQPQDFMEELVSCWKHGLNPQVIYHGFLPQEDFDKSIAIFMGKKQ